MSTISGNWIAAEPKLWFLLQQNGPEVRGVFHDEKVFTCEITAGSFVGNKLSLTWETSFSWLNKHEQGTAVLALSADGSTLSGDFVSNLVAGKWVLPREGATPPKPAAKPIQPRPAPRPAHKPSPPTSQQPYVPYHDRIIKEVSDAQNDRALLERLRKRANVEPELKDRLRAYNLLDDSSGA